jgi:hypothetical protein
MGQVIISGKSKGGPAPINIVVTNPDGTSKTLPSSIDADGNYSETISRAPGTGYTVQVTIPEDAFFGEAISPVATFTILKEAREITVAVN